jgi:hypothetical protein
LYLQGSSIHLFTATQRGNSFDILIYIYPNGKAIITGNTNVPTSNGFLAPLKHPLISNVSSFFNLPSDELQTLPSLSVLRAGRFNTLI